MSCEPTIVRFLFLAIGYGCFLFPGTVPVSSRAAENSLGMRTEGERIFLETNHLTYVLGTNGLNVAFRDRQSGKNYLDTSDPSPFMRISKNGESIDAVSVEFARGFLFVTFRPSTGPPVMAKIHPRTVRNPGLTLNGKSITFPVTIEPGWYLEYAGRDPARIFDANGFLQAEVMPVGPPPQLTAGNNSLRFFCDRGPDFGETVEVTPITRGKPLQ